MEECQCFKQDPNKGLEPNQRVVEGTNFHIGAKFSRIVKETERKFGREIIGGKIDWDLACKVAATCMAVEVNGEVRNLEIHRIPYDTSGWKFKKTEEIGVLEPSSEGVKVGDIFGFLEDKAKFEVIRAKRTGFVEFDFGDELEIEEPGEKERSEETIEVMRGMPKNLKEEFKDFGYDIDSLADQYEEMDKEKSEKSHEK